jgi:hypothetical protein
MIAWLIILTVILIAVLVVGLILYFVKGGEANQVNKTVKKRLDDMSKAMSSAVSRSIDMSDMTEFKDLDPAYKSAYKRYVVNKIMPALNKSLNKNVDNIKPLLVEGGIMDKVVDDMIKEMEAELAYAVGLAKAETQTPPVSKVGKAPIEKFVNSNYFQSRISDVLQKVKEFSR